MTILTVLGAVDVFKVHVGMVFEEIQQQQKTGTAVANQSESIFEVWKRGYWERLKDYVAIIMLNFPPFTFVYVLSTADGNWTNLQLKY